MVPIVSPLINNWKREPWVVAQKALSILLGLGNITGQVILWVTQSQTLVARHWNPGVWALFGVGSILVVVGLWLEVHHIHEELKRLKEVYLVEAPGWRARLKALWLRLKAVGINRWLLLASLLVGFGGNLVVVGLMWAFQCPLTAFDYWLMTIAGVSLVVMLPVVQYLPQLPWFQGLGRFKRRLMVVLGICGRSFLQAAMGIRGMLLDVAALGSGPLAGVSIVGAIFVGQAWLQDKQKRTPDTLLLLCMYIFNFLTLLLMCGATIRTVIS